MITRNNLLNPVSDSINPCLGCISLNCRRCICAAEKTMAGDYRAETKQRKKEAHRKETSTLPNPIFSVKPANPLGEVKEYVRLPEFICNTDDTCFVMLAAGDGMKNAGISNGDYLVCAEREAQNGDIVVADVDGVRACRRYFHEGNKVRIRREDGCTPDTITSNCIVYGVCISIIHNLQRTGGCNENS